MMTMILRLAVLAALPTHCDSSTPRYSIETFVLYNTKVKFI
jgi:hypothetical protein